MTRNFDIAFYLNIILKKLSVYAIIVYILFTGGVYMFLIRAIIRPEKVNEVLENLFDSGFRAATKMSVYGRGRQQGNLGDLFYEEILKEMIIIIVEEYEKDKVVDIIMNTARTQTGSLGDGRIFILPIDEAYSITSGNKGLGI